MLRWLDLKGASNGLDEEQREIIRECLLSPYEEDIEEAFYRILSSKVSEETDSTPIPASVPEPSTSSLEPQSDVSFGVTNSNSTAVVPFQTLVHLISLCNIIISQTHLKPPIIVEQPHFFYLYK